MIMIGLGISQFKSKEPVGFYSGGDPPTEEQISDVDAWNKKHGIMWIVYGCCIAASWICGLLIGESIYVLIPYTIAFIVPVIFMIRYHHKLMEKYYKK